MRGVLRSLVKAQSNVLGTVLLFAIVVTVSLTVIVAGGAILETSQTTTSLEGAVLAMAEVDGQIDELGTAPGSTKQVSFERLADGGSLAVHDEGHLRVVVNDTGSPGVVLDDTLSMGKIVFERDGRAVAYQGGGIWRSSGDGESVMVSPPKFDYRYEDGQPTLTLPAVTVTGSASAGAVTLRQTEERTVFPGDGADNPLDGGEDVTLEVDSEYYRAWGRLFENRTNGTVEYDHAAQNVSVVLHGSEAIDETMIESLPGAVHSRSPSVLEFNNYAKTGSYNSSDQPVTSFDGGQGDVFVDGEFEPVNLGVEIGGDVVATANSNFTNTKSTRKNVSGDVTVGGSPSELTNVTGYQYVGGSFSTQSSLAVSGDDENHTLSVGGDVYVGGDVEVLEYAEVDGDVYVQGDLQDCGPYVQVQGEAYVGGVATANPTVDCNMTVNQVADPPEPRTPNVPQPNASNDLIDQKRQDLATDNDNASAQSTLANVSDTTPGVCDPCELSAGRYYLPHSLNLDQDRLTLDTTGGPIEIYAEQDGSDGPGLRVSNSNLTILGDNPVHIYTPGNFEIHQNDGIGHDAQVVTRPDPYRAENLKVFVRDDADAKFNNKKTEFTGVLYGPGDPNGANLTITNDATIYGAVVGDASDVNSNASIYFDESLAGKGGYRQVERVAGSVVRFVHVTSTTVEVEE